MTVISMLKGNGAYTDSPVSWATTKKTRWATLHTQIQPLILSPPPNFRGGPRKVGHYTHTKQAQILVFVFLPYSGLKIGTLHHSLEDLCVLQEDKLGQVTHRRLPLNVEECWRKHFSRVNCLGTSSMLLGWYKVYLTFSLFNTFRKSFSFWMF